jgi:hypothetical protein
MDDFKMGVAVVRTFVMAVALIAGYVLAGARWTQAEVGAKWIRPGADNRFAPVWGLEGGIQVGLWPAPGPRGLFRIYAPYAGSSNPRMINFVSVEPVASGKRGQSELEKGMQSGRSGLEFRTVDSLEEAAAPREPDRPAAGRIVTEQGREALTFFVVPEPFRNGARPIIQVILRRDRPHEVAFRLYSGKGGAPMKSCVLSATMGNYARTRQLWLKDEIVAAGDAWPEFLPDRLGFTPWKTWNRDRLLSRDSELIAAVTQDEADPANVKYDSRVANGWHYRGERVTQYWRTKDTAGAVVRVNGRRTYWMSDAPIPGGIAFENFEMEAPFRAGQQFTFGVTTDSPEKLGFRVKGSMP